MRCLPLFSSVGTEMSSLLCAFSFRHPCGAGRWGKATAPCSHPGGSRSESRRRANMESAPAENGGRSKPLPYRHLNISAYPDPIRFFNSSFFTLHYYLFTCCCCERKSSPSPTTEPGASTVDEVCNLKRNGGRSKPLPYRYLNISSYPNQKQTFHFAVRRNFTPKAHHFPLAKNITRRRRISLCNRLLQLHPFQPSLFSARWRLIHSMIRPTV